jgi:hypothetical protein
MDSNQNKKFGTFPDPFADHIVKSSKGYGLKYAKAIQSQWGDADSHTSLYRQRMKKFEEARDYAAGTQDTNIYKQILNSLDPNNGDGTLLNLDWSPVPIIPKFVKIVVNKILSKKPYPNVEAIDPVSLTEKEFEKNKILFTLENKEMMQELENAGLNIPVDLKSLPETSEEAEIFFETHIKIASEIAAQIATNLTLEWNEFNDTIYRRAVEDLVTCGMAVIKRENDPNYGIKELYVDPAYFIHSYTEDPSFSDLVYAGHIRRMSISDLKRIVGDELSEEQYEKIANQVKGKHSNDSRRLGTSQFDTNTNKQVFGYDEFIVEVLDFEFLSVDNVFYEEKQSRFGNVGFYNKGFVYTAPKGSVFDRKPVNMQTSTIYGGLYIMGCEYIVRYGMKNNIPKNIHDISRARLSYSVVSTNIRRMIPKSMVSGIIGFADQLQITHLKIQQAIAKAKPDGIIVDIEGLENVQLGMGGELQPLDIQDIYEQTGIFYYRSKNPEGGFQNPPIRTIDNQIRNINELIALYNHYLRMIRDATGINEVMDGTTPKGEQLVGVREQAINAGNNAIYDITHASLVLYRKVCEDVVRCIQILPKQSVIYKVYEKAIGKESMKVLNQFRDLPMFNFGIKVVTEMNEIDRVLLEQNIQQSLAQKELDIEDAIAIRRLKDIDQAERLLIIRRKKRIARLQEQNQQNIMAQAQANAQTQQMAAQSKAQEIQLTGQVKAQISQLEAQLEMQRMQMEHQFNMELERIKTETAALMKQSDHQMRTQIETKRETAKDERVKKQAIEQSKLISQRQGKRDELQEPEQDLLSQLMGM